MSEPVSAPSRLSSERDDPEATALAREPAGSGKVKPGAERLQGDQPADSVDRINLSTFIPYLVDRNAEWNNRIQAHVLAPLELSREMFRVITTIERFGPQSLTELAAHTSINPSTLSRLIGRMERRKLVRRTRVPGGQTVRIEVLPLGSRKNAMVTVAGREFERALIAELGDDVDELRRLLHKLHDAFEAASELFQVSGPSIPGKQERRNAAPGGKATGG